MSGRSRGVTLAKLLLAVLIASALLSPAAALDRDAVYRAQPTLLADEIEALAPQRPGGPDLYFIGFAGFAGQDVFMKEVETVRGLFDGRFGTRDRSLLLVNNPKTAERLPLASAGNLRLALDGVAAKMNVDKDVLFLFLTSHGSENRVAVSFPPLRLEDLSPGQLREMLDRAGIRWRIIVISACYSGSFVDALKDRHTLIMTAASRDRSSFGCSNENDFTYFGDAYFNQALRHGTSFVAAFDEAQRLIAAREHQEELTPSNPQIYVGEAIQQKLASLEQRFGDGFAVAQATGAADALPCVTQKQLNALLSAQGYTEIRLSPTMTKPRPDISCRSNAPDVAAARAHPGWNGTAMKDGRLHNIRVDAAGRVTTEE